MTSLTSQHQSLKMPLAYMAAALLIGAGLVLMGHTAQLQTEISTGDAMRLQIQMAAVLAAILWVPTISIAPHMTGMVWMVLATTGIWASAISNWAGMMMHLPS